MVIAVVAGHETKKSVRVHVITDPCGADDVELACLACGEVDLPLLVVEADLDAELFFPHLLNGYGDGGVRLAGVKEQFKFRKTFAAGKACLGWAGGLDDEAPWNWGVGSWTGRCKCGNFRAKLGGNLHGLQIQGGVLSRGDVLFLV